MPEREVAVNPGAGAGTPDVPVTTSEGAPGVPGAEGEGVAVPAGGGPVCFPIKPVGADSGPFTADVTVVEGAKDAVRTLARHLAGVADSEVTVPACAEISSQAVSACGAQWIMVCDLTPGKLYFVTYDRAQLAYFVDAYAHVPGPGGRLTAPGEHGYA